MVYDGTKHAKAKIQPVKSKPKLSDLKEYNGVPTAKGMIEDILPAEIKKHMRTGNVIAAQLAKKRLEYIEGRVYNNGS